MKTLILIMSVMALGLMGVGCSKSNSQNGVTPANTTATVPGAVIIDPTPGTNTTGKTPVFSGGSTGAFTPVSMAVMNEYITLHPLNAPSNFKVNVNLAQSTAGRYGGTVTISYIDNGIQYDGVFNAGTGTNQSIKGLYDNGKAEAEYNYWFKYENQ